MSHSQNVIALGALLATMACSAQSSTSATDAGAVAWVATGDHASFPSPLTVDKATAITIDGTYIYWITNDGFLYRAPRAGGDIARVTLPAPGTLLGAHNDIFVGWTDSSGNGAVADIDTTTGTVLNVNHQSGALVGMVAGQRGYSFATGLPNGTRVQTCLDGACVTPPDIPSGFLGLALDLPTKTFYVLTGDGLRTCTLSGGCPTQATNVGADAKLIAALPGKYYLVDSHGQPSGMGGTPDFGSPAAPPPSKLIVVDGNGHTSSDVATWSNGSQVAQCLLTTGATTDDLGLGCIDFDVDATGRPVYCLAGPSMIRIIP